MQSILKTIRKLATLPGIAEIMAVLGSVAFLIQAGGYAHRLVSSLDEGNYLYKGWLFATGAYTPFQPYGPWTNKMPLAFVIPGWGQALFGTGLRSGRYLAIVFGLLTLLGLWLLARRVGGRWWAAAAIWVVAANPFTVGAFSVAVSEGLSACMLTWSLFLCLREKGETWQDVLAAVLAVLVVMTRQNMLPVVGFVVLFSFWQHGRRAGWTALGVSILALVVCHAPYMPTIAQRIWLPWIPDGWFPFIDAWRVRSGATGSTWNQGSYDLLTRLFAFWQGTRHNFVPMAGALGLWLFWPKKVDWKSTFTFRAAVLLSLLYLVMAVAHIMASVGGAACVFCYDLYPMFYLPVGLLLIPLTLQIWQRHPGWWRQALAVLVTLACVSGVFFGAYPELDDFLLNLPVPRMRGLQLQGGTTELGGVLRDKFGMSLEVQQKVVPPAFGLLMGVLLLLGVGVYYLVRRRRSSPAGVGYISLVGLLVAGAVLSPTVLFGNDSQANCGDIIASYENTGNQLAKTIPAGALVYWKGGLSPVPMLYLNGARTFPPLLNDGYSYRLGGEPDHLSQIGFWNQENSRQWLREADYALVEGRYRTQSFRQELSDAGYVEINSTERVEICRGDSEIFTYRRLVTNH